MRELLIATTNPNKLKELLAAMGELPFTVLTLADFPDAGDVDETASTLEGNAIIKAFMYGKRTGKLTLAEDTGIAVDALDGRPGVYSARYAENDKARNTKLLDEMKEVPSEKRTAHFRSVVAIYDPVNGDRIVTGEGRVDGRIVESPRGDKGWGYEPVFEYESTGRTYAEMERGEKILTSHRGRAALVAKELLKQFV